MKRFILLIFFMPVLLFAQKSQPNKYLTEKDYADYYLFKSNLDSAGIHFEKMSSEDQTPNTLFFKALCEATSNNSQSATINFTRCLQKITTNKKRLNELVIAEEMRTTNLSKFDLPMNELFTTKYRDAYIWRAASKFDSKDYYGSIADVKLFIQSLNGQHTPKAYLYYGKSLACLGKFTLAITYLNDVINSLKGSEESTAIWALSEAYYYKGLSELSLKQKQKGCEDLSESAQLGNENAFEQIKNNCNN